MINLREDFKEKKNIPYIKRRKKRNKKICRKTVEKEIYQILKVTLDFTSIFCKKERSKEKNSIELLILKQENS